MVFGLFVPECAIYFKVFLFCTHDNFSSILDFAVKYRITNRNSLFCNHIKVKKQQMDSFLGTFLEILKYTLPALIMLMVTYMIVSKFLTEQTTRKQLALFHETQNITIPMRLQAYERLTLYVERIKPRNLLNRVYQKDMNVAVYEAMLVQTIKAEYDHNLAQQIYVSRLVWQTVSGVKEQEINIINTMARRLNPEAPAKELHKALMEYILSDEGEQPTDVALQIITDESRRILTHGPQA